MQCTVDHFSFFPLDGFKAARADTDSGMRVQAPGGQGLVGTPFTTSSRRWTNKGKDRQEGLNELQKPPSHDKPETKGFMWSGPIHNSIKLAVQGNKLMYSAQPKLWVVPS